MKIMVKKAVILLLCLMFIIPSICVVSNATQSKKDYDDSWLVDYYEDENEREAKEREEKNKNNMQSELTQKDKNAITTSRDRMSEITRKVRKAILIGGLVIFAGMCAVAALIVYRRKIKENQEAVFKAQTERKTPVMKELPTEDEEIVRMSKEFDRQYEEENRNENKYLNDYDE